MALFVIISPLFILLLSAIILYNVYKFGYKRGLKSKPSTVSKSNG